jgi:hypothetical protein
MLAFRWMVADGKASPFTEDAYKELFVASKGRPSRQVLDAVGQDPWPNSSGGDGGSPSHGAVLRGEEGLLASALGWSPSRSVGR